MCHSGQVSAAVDRWETTLGLEADCPARAALDLFASRWLAVVLYCLRNGPRRPVALRAEIGGISDKVLQQTLRTMTGEGLIRRRRYAESPPRVDYELTDAGRDLLVPIMALGQWAAKHRVDD